MIIEERVHRQMDIVERMPMQDHAWSPGQGTWKIVEQVDEPLHSNSYASTFTNGMARRLTYEWDIDW